MRTTIAICLALHGSAAIAQPDIIVRAPASITSYGEVGGIRAYSAGFELCNLGASPAEWDCCTNRHPITAQNFYRLSGGRFEQIGMSWATHEFSPLQQSTCGFCTPGTGSTLGAGCSTPTSAGGAGTQSRLGPRSEINASTGVFLFPFGGTPAEPVIGRRLQIRAADLDVPGSLWFIESVTVSPDDAAANRAGNNGTYRRATVAAAPALSIGLVGEPQPGRPAVYAWRDNALGAGAPSGDVRVTPFGFGDGSLFLASSARLVGGVWRYEYALENLNSDRGVGDVEMLIPQGAGVGAIGFHDVDYHSGEPYSGADWADSFASGRLAWSTEAFASNPNANAIRWGTLYNFRFESAAPPVFGAVRVRAFKPASGAPGAPGSVLVGAVVPGPACPDADFDGLVTFADLNIVLSGFGLSGLALPGDFNGDQRIDFGDLNIALGGFGGACPTP